MVKIPFFNAGGMGSGNEDHTCYAAQPKNKQMKKQNRIITRKKGIHNE